MRLITKEECIEKIEKAKMDLKILKKEKALPEKKVRAKMTRVLWEELKNLINAGEIITMDNESRIYRIQDVSSHN